jgi:hypothetical protein
LGLHQAGRVLSQVRLGGPEDALGMMAGELKAGHKERLDVSSENVASSLHGMSQRSYRFIVCSATLATLSLHFMYQRLRRLMSSFRYTVASCHVSSMCRFIVCLSDIVASCHVQSTWMFLVMYQRRRRFMSCFSDIVAFVMCPILRLFLQFLIVSN